MAKFALLVELKAKPGKEPEVEAFLETEASQEKRLRRCLGTRRKLKVSLEPIGSSTPSTMNLPAKPI